MIICTKFDAVDQVSVEIVSLAPDREGAPGQGGVGGAGRRNFVMLTAENAESGAENRRELKGDMGMAGDKEML